MYGQSVNCYCTDGPGRAQEFAGTAADAVVCRHNRDRPVETFGLDHAQGSCRAVTCTIAAIFLVRGGKAEFEVYPCLAYAYGEFLVSLDGPYCICGAYFAACSAFRAAKALVVAHLWLEEVLKVS